jgi:hypothetical protein
VPRRNDSIDNARTSVCQNALLRSVGTALYTVLPLFQALNNLAGLGAGQHYKASAPVKFRTNFARASSEGSQSHPDHEASTNRANCRRLPAANTEGQPLSILDLFNSFKPGLVILDLHISNVRRLRRTRTAQLADPY